MLASIYQTLSFVNFGALLDNLGLSKGERNYIARKFHVLYSGAYGREVVVTFTLRRADAVLVDILYWLEAYHTVARACSFNSNMLSTKYWRLVSKSDYINMEV